MGGIQRLIVNPKNPVFENGRVYVTYGFMDPDYGGRHYGADCCAGGRCIGDWVVADEAGVVEYVKGTVIGFAHGSSPDAYGNNIIIRHSEKDKSRFCHLKYGSIQVKEGQLVRKGQRIAYMGGTGYSFGDHLHYERIVNGERADPLPYITGTERINVSAAYRRVTNPITRQYTVNVALLNCRVAPTLKAELAITEPLRKGTKLIGFLSSVVEADGLKWIRVSYSKPNCWVALKYLSEE